MSAQMAPKLARVLAKRVAEIPEPAGMPDRPIPPLPESVIDAAVAALKRGETHYTDRPGVLELRALAAEGLKRFGVELKPKDITITCGTTEARFAALKLLAKPETDVVCPGDASAIAGVARLVGAHVTKATDGPVSVLYLTPNDPQSVIQPLLDQLVSRGWWVIWDLSLATPENRSKNYHPASDPALLPRVVTIDGLSHWMPGWRVGWMAGSEAAERLRSLKQSMTICTTSVSQWAAVEMVKSHAAQS